MSDARYNHITDAELLQKAITSHDNSWLGILLQRYTLLLLGVCMKYLKDEAEAQDAVQQVFLKVIQEVHKYKIDYFKSWLYMVAKNHCLTQLRNQKGKIAVPLEEQAYFDAAFAEDAAPLALQDEQLFDHLKEALKDLNAEQQQCVTLFYLQKLSYQEITAVTSYSLLQVKSYIQNGKRNLKLIITKKINQQQQQHG